MPLWLTRICPEFVSPWGCTTDREKSFKSRTMPWLSKRSMITFKSSDTSPVEPIVTPYVVPPLFGTSARFQFAALFQVPVPPFQLTGVSARASFEVDDKARQ